MADLGTVTVRAPRDFGLEGFGEMRRSGGSGGGASGGVGGARTAAPAPALPPAISPPTLTPPSELERLLQQPKQPQPFQELLEKPRTGPTNAPLGEVTVKGKKARTRVGGRGGGIGGLLTILRFAPLALFPSPIGDQPDDPRDFGEKIKGEPEPESVATPEPTETPLETVTVTAKKPQPRERPEPSGTPDLARLPEPFVKAPSPFKPKTSPFPQTRKSPDFDLVLRPVPLEFQDLITKPRGGVGTRPLPQPVPRPSPFPIPGADLIGSPPGSNLCECNCPKPKKRKPRAPRVVCREGTYVETAKGLIKRPTRIIPC